MPQCALYYIACFSLLQSVFYLNRYKYKRKYRIIFIESLYTYDTLNTKGESMTFRNCFTWSFCFLGFIGALSNAGAAEQIEVPIGEVYNITDSTYEMYQSDSINGAVAVVNGDLNVTANAKFLNNKGKLGGVFYNLGNISITSADGNSLFGANEATLGGAIYNTNSGKISEISHSLFQRNQSDSGGAIYNSGQGAFIDRIANSSFIENTAKKEYGGAIYNQGSITSIEQVAFLNNSASSGGAISNDVNGRIGNINATFNGNRVLLGELKQGGAISNSGVIESITDSKFIGNRAGDLGGAIYNASTGSITFKGSNSFSGNIAGGNSNDILNDGQIIIADGITTIGSGISGDGTLTVQDGATLSIGSTTLNQGVLNLDGVLSASIVNQKNFGKIDVDKINIGATGKLDLTLGATGIYDFGTDISAGSVSYNDSIYTVSIDGSNLVVKTKSVEDIVDSTNLSSDAAVVVIGLSNSSSYSLNIASLNAQSALESGDLGYIEKESEILLGEGKPIVQSVASVLQTQLFSMATNRMNMSDKIEKDIDENVAYGFWAQGLMNTSKYADAFTGDTNGVAVGLDALIKKHYMLGLAFSYNQTDITANERDTEVTSNNFMLYGQYKPNNWYVNAALNYAMSDYVENAIAFGVIINPEYSVDSFGGQLITGYDFGFGLTPEVGARYLYISQDGYDNGFAEVAKTDFNYLTAIAGVKYALSFETEGRLKFIPEVRAAFTYDVISDDNTSSVTIPGIGNYITYGDKLSELGGEFGIGLSLAYNEWNFSLNYDLDIRESYNSQTGSVNFKYTF